MIYIYIIGIVISLIGVLIKGKNKTLTSISMAITFFLMASEKSTAFDIKNYMGIYENLEQWKSISWKLQKIDYGYIEIMSIAKSIGLNFFIFRAIVLALCILLISKALNRYCENSCLFWLVFFVNGIFVNSMQFRNFISLSILIYSLKYLIEDEKNNSIKYCLAVILASMFHQSFLLYLVFVLVKCKRTIFKNIWKVTLVISVPFSMILIKSGVFRSIMLYLGNRLENIRLIVYGQNLARVGFLLPSSLFFVSLFFVTYIYKTIAIHECKLDIVSYKVEKFKVVKKCKQIDFKAISKVIYLINIIALSYIPLLMINVGYYRLLRNIWIIDILFFTIFLNLHKGLNKKKMLVIFIFIILIFAWDIFEYLIYCSPKSIIEPLIYGEPFFKYI